jgi:2,4-dienoyl-CoA reductase-like NADH-dependent reductase (Old Yellow Enzyme family)
VPADASPLFRPLRIKGHTIRNRIVMPPMVTNRDIVGHEGLDWYAERAAGGVGLVIVESTAVGRFEGELTVAALRSLVEVIHGHGALAAIQLFPMTERLPLGWDTTPADLDPAQIESLLLAYEVAARMCAEAGFEGVEPHGAHGFLLNQFFSPRANKRTDRYGGSPANRMRMGLEAARAARRGLGDGKLLLYRHTPVSEGDYGLGESLRFAEKLLRAGVDVLDISPASAQAPGDLAEPFRRFGAPVIAVGTMDEVDRAVATLTRGRADLIAVGRGLIADPQWPRKVQAGRMDEIVRCIRDDKCFADLGEGVPVQCSQW